MSKAAVIDYFNEHYPTDVVDGLLDQEIIEWVDDGWEDGYESEYDYYIDHNSGEAEAAVRNMLIAKACDYAGTNLEFEDIDCIIRDLYDVLDKS